MDIQQYNYTALAYLLLAAYLIGSIPFGLILTRLAGLGDIRQIGSGNIGATNVLRTGNKKLAALTLFLDGFKGFLAVTVLVVLLAGRVSFECFETVRCDVHDVDVYALAGLAALIGHMFPIWLKFKGGKGVATILGVTLGLNWVLGLLACATWLAMAFLFRYSSLSALVAVAALPVFALAFGHQGVALPFALMALLVWARHHQNISRLIKGTEPKIGKKG